MSTEEVPPPVSTPNDSSDSDRDDPFFIGAVTSDEEISWTVDIRVRQKTVTFKMDTGAEVTAISSETYEMLGRPKLTKPSKALYGPAHQALDAMGQFTVWLKYGQHSTRQRVYVVGGLQTNLLGLPAMTKLQLVSRVNATSVEEENEIARQFPNVFKGLGTIGDEYTIKLKESAIPHSLYVPRKVPIPNRPKVKAELERMEQLGVISKVEAPTAWCAGMVATPKKNGDTRICVDLKSLNDYVLREPHPLPSVDELLAMVAGSTRFSKLDANSGFWQIPLAEESRPLTTFITPFGRYKFNKLPFGISCATELFQKRMSKILEGLEGVLVLVDDVLIFAPNKEEHDRRLTAALKRIQDAGATLNRAKCEFDKDSRSRDR